MSDREKRMSDGCMVTFYAGVTSYEIADGLTVRPGEYILTHPGGAITVLDYDGLVARYGKEAERWTK